MPASPTNPGSAALVDASPPRRPRPDSKPTRDALLAAAVVEFAARGFEGASTRRIAEAAGTHQPQINYHFGSKEALWQASVEHLFADFDARLAARTPGVDPAAPTAAEFATVLRALVVTIAELPELNRMMSSVATVESDRLVWLVDRHLRGRFANLAAVWRELGASGATTAMDAEVFYFSLLGVCSLAYINAPQARLLGIDTSAPAFIEAHADAVARMFVPGVGR